MTTTAYYKECVNRSASTAETNITSGSVSYHDWRFCACSTVLDRVELYLIIPLYFLVLRRSTTMATSPWELEPLVVTLRDPFHSEGLQ